MAVEAYVGFGVCARCLLTQKVIRIYLLSNRVMTDVT